jgi:hypothetical protein
LIHIDARSRNWGKAVAQWTGRDPTPRNLVRQGAEMKAF